MMSESVEQDVETGRPLNARQLAFVREYIVDGNATQSAIRAGYSPEPKSAGVIGHNLLKNVKIAAAIEQSHADAAEAALCGAIWVKARLKEIGLRCMQASPVFDRKGEPVMIEAADGSIVPAYTFDASAAIKAFELIGKDAGMFKQQVEHSGSVSFVVER